MRLPPSGWRRSGSAARHSGALPMPGRRKLRPRAALAASLVLALGCALWFGVSLRHERDAAEKAAALTGGDPALGRTLLVRYGCSACHRTPGVWPSAEGVGPPLGGLSK